MVYRKSSTCNNHRKIVKEETFNENVKIKFNLKKMTSQKFFNFFATEKGRTTVFAGVALAGVSLFSGNFLPQTILLSQYKEIIQSYQ